MPRILALVDGSIYSESVCDHAAWVARKKGASVEVMHVLGREGPAKSDLSGNIGLGARSKLMSDLAELDAQKARLAKTRGKAILEDAAKRLRDHGVEEVTTRLRHGDLIEELRRAEEGADLVVVGKRGEAADFEKLSLGSHLELAVRASVVPVLVTSRAFRPIETALIAFDGGRSALKAIDHLSRSPVFSGVRMRIVMAGAETPERRRMLDGAKAQLRAAGYDIDSSIVAGRADSVIEEQAREQGADIIVMGAFGHSRIRQLFIGSTTAEMLRGCQVPLLLFR